MNPLKSITGTIVSGVVLSAIIMMIYSDGSTNPLEWTVWFHVLAGITWIGLLYYFNFIQVPAVATALSEVEGGGPGAASINKYIAPKALLWFRCCFYSSCRLWKDRKKSFLHFPCRRP